MNWIGRQRAILCLCFVVAAKVFAADPPVIRALKELGWTAEDFQTVEQVDQAWTALPNESARMKMLQNRPYTEGLTLAEAMKKNYKLIREWVANGKLDPVRGSIDPSLLQLIDENYHPSDGKSVARVVTILADRMDEYPLESEGITDFLLHFFGTHKGELGEASDRVAAALALARIRSAAAGVQNQADIAAESEKLLSSYWRQPQPPQLLDIVVAKLLNRSGLTSEEASRFLQSEFLNRRASSPESSLVDLLSHPAWRARPERLGALVHGLGKLGFLYDTLNVARIRSLTYFNWSHRKNLGRSFLATINTVDWTGKTAPPLTEDAVALVAYYRECLRRNEE